MKRFVSCSVVFTLALSGACSPRSSGLPGLEQDVLSPPSDVQGIDGSVPDVTPTSDVIISDLQNMRDGVAPIDAPRPVDVPTTPDVPSTPDVPTTPDVVDAGGGPLACDRPGATERVACGMCGTLERFCNAMRRWESGACTGEGMCAPGTSTTRPCGRCGTRTVRCSDTCSLVETGTCMGEGVCTPGEMQRTAMGCPTDQTRLVRCSTACALTEEVEACRATPRLDVILLVDATGSFRSDLTSIVSAMQTRLATPLLALPDAHVGVSFFADFQVSPYGETGDRAYMFGAEPAPTATSLTTALSGRPMMNGGDGSDSVTEAISVLAGGAVHPLVTTPPRCSAGRVAGGCWRATSRRVVIVIGDSVSHNGPAITGTTLFDPYGVALSPAGARWPDVLASLRGTNTTLLFVTLSSSSTDTLAQHRRMVTDLGQPMSDVFSFSLSSFSTTADQVVTRVRALVGM
jgi:hypothetical protein